MLHVGMFAEFEAVRDNFDVASGCDSWAVNRLAAVIRDFDSVARLADVALELNFRICVPLRQRSAHIGLPLRNSCRHATTRNPCGDAIVAPGLLARPSEAQLFSFVLLT